MAETGAPLTPEQNRIHDLVCSRANTLLLEGYCPNYSAKVFLAMSMELARKAGASETRISEWLRESADNVS